MMNAEPQRGDQALNPIRIPVSFSDIRAGIRHDLRVATEEGFRGVAQRAIELLDQLERAELRARDLGHYQLDLVFTFPPHLQGD